MPKKKTDQERTPIGRFVRELRRKHGDPTQQEFQSGPLGFTKLEQYVSKVENGVVRTNIDREFLEAVSRLANEPIEHLLDLVAQDVRAGQPQGTEVVSSTSGGGDYEFSLVFGHCIWGAPIALAAMEKLNTDFRIGSFWDPNISADSTKESIRWIHELKHSHDLVPGPTGGDAMKAITAVEALALLKEKKIDVAAVPGNIVGATDPLVRVASIVDSASGCTLVCNDGFFETLRQDRPQRAKPGDRPIFADEVVRAVAGKKGGSRIAFEFGTVAHEMLDDGCHAAARNLSRHIPDEELEATAAKVASKSGATHGSAQWIKVYSKALLAKSSPVEDPSQMFWRIAMDTKTRNLGTVNNSVPKLTWQPQASWLQKQGSEKLHCLPIHFPFGVDMRPRHLTFTLVIRADAVSSAKPRMKALRGALVELIDLLGSRAELLNGIDSRTTGESKPAELLSWYFDLKEANSDGPETQEYVKYRPFLEAVGGVRYTAYLHGDAIRQKLFRIS